MSASVFDGAEISSATAMVDYEGLPGFCRIQGTIHPDIGFEARFPLSDWNGKYYQSGCGGYCGSVLADKPGFSNSINEALKKGFATITTNGGHEGGPGDASWAEGNPEAVEVYAHKGIALTHAAGTAMLREFYNDAASRHYFGGCSTGGRMAAKAAQLYPKLFDGILGGGGVLHLSYSGGVYGSWVVQANTDNDGRRILNKANFAAKLPALNDAVVKQCDATDGEEDGILAAPRMCVVDVNALPACDQIESDQCFTARERSVLAKWYQGPRNSSGEQLFPGMPAGSEPFWNVWFLDSEDSVAPGNLLGGNYARYLGFPGGTPEGYSAMDFDFDRDPERLHETGRQLDALDPDLNAFEKAGGKYLMWHGWADPLVLPEMSLNYYESVATEMGGFERISPFFRLFMVPGHGHCWELPAELPDRFDPIATLDKWVESGVPPVSIKADQAATEEAKFSEALLCPHPSTAVFPASGKAVGALSC